MSRSIKRLRIWAERNGQMRVIINHKNGEKEILTNIDDIDMYRDHIDIYFYYPEDEPIPTRTVYKKDVKSVYQEYDYFGDKRIERIL